MIWKQVSVEQKEKLLFLTDTKTLVSKTEMINYMMYDYYLNGN